MNEELSQEELAGEQLENQPRRNPAEHLKPWQFQPGKSGNPLGKPKGTKSLKTYAQEMLRDMTDEQKLEYLKGLDKDKIWEMGEGKPKQDIEHNAEKAMLIKIDE